MLHKISLLILIGLVLSGCSGQLPALMEDAQVEKIRADNKGIVLVHTSLHEREYFNRCDTITAWLAQAHESGVYIQLPGYEALKGPFDLFMEMPSQIILTPGDYGIVGLSCSAHKREEKYFAKYARRPAGSVGIAYEQPIVKFSVGPGEVVDIGSLRLPSRRVAPKNLIEMLGPARGEFAAVVQPIPDAALQKLASKSPNLFNARVVRPMTVPQQTR
jgi:hypothetical protein